MENKRSEDDEMHRRMWEAVETEARKVRMVKTERRSRKENKKTIERKEDESKESSRKIKDLEWRRRSSKIGGKSKKASTRILSQVDLDLWKKS